MLPDFIHTLLSSTWGIVLMLLFFNGSIVVHELGHYLAARWRKLKVTRFSIFGLGPKLISWRGKDGVEYCICALPFGAYVALPQLAEMKAIEGDDETAANLPPISYADKMIVAVAGPLFNVIFALVVAAIVWVIGYPQPASFRTTTIGYVSPELVIDASQTTAPGPAHAAGLRPGDIILRIDGTPVHRFAEVTELIALGSGRDSDNNPQTVLTIGRDGAQMDVTVHPRLVTINESSGDQLRLIGVGAAQDMVVGHVFDGSPAARAGLRAGDRLLAANGERVHSVAQFSELIAKNPAQPVNVLVEREGGEIVLAIATQPVALTRPLLNLFTNGADKAATLEIVPLYTRETIAGAGANLASASTPAQLSLHSLPDAAAAFDGYKGQWHITAVDGREVGSVAALLSALAQPRSTSAGTAANASPADATAATSATTDAATTATATTTLAATAATPTTAAVPTVATTTSAVILTLTSDKGAVSTLTLPAATVAQLVPPQTRHSVGFEIGGGAVLAHPSIAAQFRMHLETTFRTLRSLFSPSSNIGIGHLSGPVGIGRAVYSLAISDIRLVLWFTVLLNINLAILNLLPIPVLDGGHMLIATLNKLRGKALPESFIAGLQGAFMFALLGLMVYILFKDSMRWHGDSEAERHWKRQSLYQIPVRFDNGAATQPAQQTQTPPNTAQE